MSPCSTIQKIGSKKVDIRIQGKENWRVTAIFTVLANGQKLSPLLIFKEKKAEMPRRNYKS